MAFAVLAETAYTLATASALFPAAATTAVNGMLFVLIVVEISCTIIIRPEGRIVQVQTVLILGIVGAVREVLMIGMRLSSPNVPALAVHTVLLEFGAYAAVVFCLVVALVLVRRLDGTVSQAG